MNIAEFYFHLLINIQASHWRKHRLNEIWIFLLRHQIEVTLVQNNLMHCEIKIDKLKGVFRLTWHFQISRPIIPPQWFMLNSMTQFSCVPFQNDQKNELFNSPVLPVLMALGWHVVPLEYVPRILQLSTADDRGGKSSAISVRDMEWNCPFIIRVNKRRMSSWNSRKFFQSWQKLSPFFHVIFLGKLGA